MSRDRRLQRRENMSPRGTSFTPASISSRFAWFRGDLGVTLATNTVADPNNFDGAGWTTKTGITVTTNVTTDPFGGSTADQVETTAATNSHWEFQTVASMQVGYVTTLSVYAKANTANYVQLLSGTSANYQVFDLANGVLGTTALNVTSASITPAGNGWYLCSMTYTTVASGNVIAIAVRESDSTGVYLGTVKSIYLYQCSVTQRRVSGWTDQVGARNIVQSTTARQPGYSTNIAALNGRPGVYPATPTADDRLRFGGVVADWQFLHDGAGATVYMVVQTGSTWTDGTLLDSSNFSLASRGINFYHQASGSPVIRVTDGLGGAVWTHSGTSFATSTKYQILITHSTAAGYSIRRNGVVLASGAYALPAQAGDSAQIPTIMDTAVSVGNYSNWTIAEVLVCNSVISASDIAGLEAYGAARYAL